MDNKSFNFIKKYIDGARNKIENNILLKRNKLNAWNKLPENNYCVAVKEEGVYVPSYLSNVLELDEDDIKYLADKHYGNLLDEMKNKMESVSTEYTSLINEFNMLSLDDKKR